MFHTGSFSLVRESSNIDTNSCLCAAGKYMCIERTGGGNERA